MMNFLKKLFRKKAVDHFVIMLPFKPMRFRDTYLKNIIRIMANEGDQDYLTEDCPFYLIFGDETVTHIIYHGYTDIYILMEPEKDGWTATRVYVDITQSSAETGHEFDDLEFRLKIPNPCFGMPSFTDEGVDFWYPEFAAVYKEREESIA